MNIIIFAGGNGTRLWPASTKSKPKQFLEMVGKDTLLQQTYKRLKTKFKPEQIFIATQKSYGKHTKNQVPAVPVSNFSLEPSLRNRGPALGLALITIQSQSDEDIFATAWSDDYIHQNDKYLQTLLKAKEHLKNNTSTILAIGATPTSPHIGFRYIQSGKQLKNSEVRQVNKFTDKPDHKEALRYYESGKHFWNTGYFVSSINHILSLYKKYYPEAYNILMKIKSEIGKKNYQKVLEELYNKIPSFDFEEILINNPSELHVLASEFGWQDVGRWSAVKDIQSNKKDNLTKGLVIPHKTTGSLIYNYHPKQLITTLHVKDLVIVVTQDSILVANKNNSEELKEIIDLIKNKENYKKLKKYL